MDILSAMRRSSSGSQSRISTCNIWSRSGRSSTDERKRSTAFEVPSPLDGVSAVELAGPPRPGRQGIVHMEATQLLVVLRRRAWNVTHMRFGDKNRCSGEDLATGQTIMGLPGLSKLPFPF